MNVKILVCLLLLTSGDPFGDGVRAYREGRFQDALRAFAAAEREAGESVAPEVLYNKALAALAVGDLLEAESSAERAAGRGGPQYEALRDFLRGNVAFVRCEAAEVTADTPEAGDMGLESAISHGMSARAYWQRAAMTRDDWPEARRNVERALLKLKSLELKRDAREAQKRKEREAKPKPLPMPTNPDEEPPQPEERTDPENRGEVESEDVPAPATVIELSPEQVRHLIGKLKEIEAEKRRLREAVRRTGPLRVYRDW